MLLALPYVDVRRQYCRPMVSVRKSGLYAVSTIAHTSLDPERYPQIMNPNNASSSSPANSETRSIPPAELYGGVLLDLANVFGVHPLDVTLIATSIIGNLVGQKAAVLDITGRRVGPGFSIIQVGDATARFQALQDRLIEPVRTSQDWIRKAVSGCSRNMANLWEFGRSAREKGGEDDQTADEMAARTRRNDSRTWCSKMLQHGVVPPDQSWKPIGNGPYDYTSERSRDPGPGVFQLPSILLENLSLEKIAAALSEVHDRRVFVFDPVGVLWEAPPQSRRTSVSYLNVADLLRGQDYQFSPVHSNQGYGTWWHTRIGIYSTLTFDQVGDFLNQPGTPHAKALEQCILVKPRAVEPALPVQSATPGARTEYSGIISRILGDRLRDVGAVLDFNSKLSAKAVGLQRQFIQTCEVEGELFPRHVAHFHDLAYRILWSLSALRKNCPAAELIDSAFFIARAAINRHVELLGLASQRWVNRSINESAQRVQAIVKRKGPSTMRDMLRSTNIQRTERLLPGIELLISSNQMRMDRRGKYHLIENPPLREESINTESITIT